MRSYLLLLFLAVASLASAQNKSLQKLFDGTRWTDGDATYVAEINGNNINMRGGTLHEGGYAFGLVCTDPDVLFFDLVEGCWDPEYYPDERQLSLPCPAGSEAEIFSTEDNRTYLLINDDEDLPVYALRMMGDDETLYDVVTKGYTDSWRGEFSVTFSAYDTCPIGTKCSITAQKMNLGRLTSGKYQIMEEYECPTNVVKMADGRLFRIQPAGKEGDVRYGLNLYAVKYDEENDVYSDGPLMLSLSRLPGTHCRWATDTEVLLPGHITLYPRSELRLIRNEIFARHGYRFGSADLANYFKAERWYEMDEDPEVNNKIHFSAVEQYNIHILLAAANNADLYFPDLDDGTAQRAEDESASTGEADDMFASYPWTARRALRAHHEYFEAEIMPEKVQPISVSRPAGATFEWCKTEGTNFRVGLCHRRDAAGRELKDIVINEKGTDLAFPMIGIGEEAPLPEVTIHISGNYLWFELKRDGGMRYYFYNVTSHVIHRSDRQSYRNRIAPANAKDTWHEIINAQLSPKAE